jgi:hypothetical protein
LATAIIDLNGKLSFLTHKENSDVFLQLSDNKYVYRASNIEVFQDLEPDVKDYLNSQYQMDIYSPGDDELWRRFNPYDFWVELDFHDLLGPFTTREEALAAEEQELRSRNYA